MRPLHDFVTEEELDRLVFTKDKWTFNPNSNNVFDGWVYGFFRTVRLFESLKKTQGN